MTLNNSNVFSMDSFRKKLSESNDQLIESPEASKAVMNSLTRVFGQPINYSHNDLVTLITTGTRGHVTDQWLHGFFNSTKQIWKYLNLIRLDALHARINVSVVTYPDNKTSALSLKFYEGDEVNEAMMLSFIFIDDTEVSAEPISSEEPIIPKVQRTNPEAKVLFPMITHPRDLNRLIEAIYEDAFYGGYPSTVYYQETETTHGFICPRLMGDLHTVASLTLDKSKFKLVE